MVDGLTVQSIEEVLGEGFEEDTQHRHEFAFEREIGLVRVRVFSGIPRMRNLKAHTISNNVIQEE